MPILIVAGLVMLFVMWLVAEPWRLAWRRRRVAARPFPATWRAILAKRVPYVRRLPADLQLQLKKHIQVFLAEKSFVGCNGLVINDEIRVTIAAQASLLLLNRGGHFPNLRQILVYPGAFVVDRVHAAGGGVMQDRREVLSGESWSQGQVILSWDDTLEGAAVPDDGRNVVIHEFAHQLDQENGPANGAPPLPHRRNYRQWSRVFSSEFDRLQREAANGEATFFNHYGATNAAEFFAVVSEVFFEQPYRMAAEHPALYRELSAFYRIDPLSW